MKKYLILLLPLIAYGATKEELSEGIAHRSAFRSPKRMIRPLPVSSYLPSPEIVYGGRWAYIVPRTQLILRGFSPDSFALPVRIKRAAHIRPSEAVIEGE